MKIEVSNGELLDKLSILEIKMQKISNPEKRVNIIREFELVKPLCDALIPAVAAEYENLLKINGKLWEIEDAIRELEARKLFETLFIETARQVYKLNDERARIKKKINRKTGSGLSEEKSYSGY